GLTDPDHDATANATVTGTVIDDRSAANLTVEFDDGNGTSYGVTKTDANGNFQYQPTGMAYNPQATIRARAVEWNPLTQSLSAGAWSSLLSFSYKAPTGDPPRLVGALSLGDPLPGADPTRPSLRGQAVSEHSLAGIAIDFDFSDANGGFDGIADQSATTDANGN